MNDLTKYDTILWIKHAIANFKGIGKNQKKLSEQLGIEETRLSEMKAGKAVMTPNLMKKITELCGTPRRNPGRFEYAELYDDLNLFFSCFADVTEKRFYRQILNTLENVEYIELISENCTFTGESKGHNNEAILKRIPDYPHYSAIHK